MKESTKNSNQKKNLEQSIEIIYNEITQNLCTAKLKLAMSEDAELEFLKENVKISHDLISISIQQLRIVGDLIIEKK